MPPSPRPLVITLPDWVGDRIAATPPLATDAERVAFTVALAREQVVRGGGGPFAAAVFEEGSGRLVAAGVNLVEPLGNAALHAEVVALMFAEQALGSWSLAAPPLARPCMLATSCAPCAMCLGAVHWSGVVRVACGATREDAMAAGFDEGPVFPESIAYLEARGIRFVQGLARDAARAVLADYVAGGGHVYNAARPAERSPARDDESRAVEGADAP